MARRSNAGLKSLHPLIRHAAPICAFAYVALFVAALLPQEWWPSPACRLAVLLSSLALVAAYGGFCARRRSRHTARRRDVEGQVDEALIGARCLLWRATVRDIDGALEWDIYVSDEDAANRFLPLKLARGESYAEAWYRAKHPDDKSRMDELGARSLRGGAPGYSQEFRTICADGTVRWLLETVSIKSLGPNAWSCVGVCADITDRKRAEEEVQESAERYRLLFERNPHPMWVYDCETLRFLAANAAAVRHYGYSESEFLEMTIQDIRPAEDLDFLRDCLAEMAMEERTFGAADRRLSRHVRRDGTIIEAEIASNPIQLGGRQARLVLATDITERRRAENALRESEERSRTLLASLPQRVFFKNVDCAFVSVNAQFARDFGQEPEDMVGKSDFDLFPKELAEKYRADDLEVMNGRIVRLLEEENIVHGESRIVEVVKAPVIDDRGIVIGVLGLFSDITERKRTEQALKAHEAFLRQVIDANPNLVYVRDAEGRYLMANRATADVYHTTVEEMIGKTDADFHIDPEFRRRYREVDREVIETGQDRLIPEDRLIDFDGRERWFQTLKTPLRDPDGAVTRALGITVDITRHKEAEMALERARDIALAATRAKSEFLANMSHEIRTPMNGILGMTSLLRDTDLDAEQREFARTIESSANALLAIINDILDFSKIEAGRMTIEQVAFSLRDVVEEVAEMLAPSAHRKGLELNVSVPPGFPARFLGDPGRVRQVLTNLIGNAIKFTERGEVHVEARLTDPDPERIAEDRPAGVRLSVRDTGIGIPPDRQAAIFDSFTQADGSTTRKYGGTGLGLAISQQLVELMGGEIGVESAPGEGSTFQVDLSLPVLEREEHAKAEESLRGVRVLAVDDNATNRRILEAQLAAWECRTVVVETAADALETLRQGIESGDPFRLVVLDMLMPGTDGVQTAAMIRSNPGLRSVPLILLSSTGDRLREEERVAKGFSAVLTKPARPASLLATLVRLLSVRESEPERTGVSSPSAEAAAIAGLRVLLAEDNEINQRVAVRLLERWGCAVRVAGSGTEAVAAFAESEFDIILMDVQMPGMDGLAATGVIREAEEASGRNRTPIIAMTARALEGDRESCTSAGMDDYVSKPVEPNTLQAVIARWTRRDDGAGTVAGPSGGTSTPVAPAGAATFRFEKLHRNCGNDEEFAAEIVSVFLRGLPRTLDRIAAAHAAGDAAEVESAAHSLTGTAGTIGADRLREYCQEMERMGRCRDLTGLGPVLESTRGEFAELEILLRQFTLRRAA
jgi:PAS domain S-box-containing protein